MGLFSNDRNTKSVETEPAPVARPEERRPPRRVETEVYGIEKAIKLMRTLPVGDDNIEIVVQVIKNTLESINVKVSSIIEDATHKQEAINRDIDLLEHEAGELEREIAARRGKISTLRSDYAETTRVKEHLILSEQLTNRETGTKPAARQAGTTDVVEGNGEGKASTYHLV